MQNARGGEWRKRHRIIFGIRMEESDRVDDEERPILEKVDLMEKFFENVHRKKV